ncbi:MAG: (d)CMP kinase [Ruminococcaceae bacterium]|nr:(d)CMP kinase [Oscillospiraceae bacterium]
MKVAIDGPAGAGKSTIARAAAAELGFVYIDTGAMYRAVALHCVRKTVNTKTDTEAVIGLLPEIKIIIRHVDGIQRIFLNGEDVSDAIRTPEISVAASDVAVIPEVRQKLVQLQRELSETADVIMDGRDIGTYVLPDAEVKVFLTADVNARAMRRYKELCEKGTETTLPDVLRDMQYRDANDAGRSFAPLRQAEDAVLVDTTTLSPEASIASVIDIIRGAKDVL